MILKTKNGFRWMVPAIAFCGVMQAQPQGQPHISAIDRQIRTNWIKVPQSFDCRVAWDIVHQQEGRWVPMENSDYNEFIVRCFREESLISEKKVTGSSPRECDFTGLESKISYRFIVLGISGQDTVSSAAAEVITGHMSAAGKREIQWYHRFPILSGRTPLSLIGREKVYDNSTEAGKMAFHVIWWFFLSSIIIMTQCWRYLRIGQVFPMEKNWAIGHGYDAIYEKNSSKKFKSIMNDWKNLVSQVHKQVRGQLTEKQSMDCQMIESAGVKFWQEQGADHMNELIKRIEIYDLYPTARIMKSGMQNHEQNGFTWMKVSEEVERTIENRASSEIEKLRRKSFMDWFWNLGTFAPMVGLFGTATGISSAFGKLEKMSTDTEQMQMVQQLAGGIYEALWTTIEGLAVGISLMLVFYYYQTKLNWIYSKWEEMYVDVTGRL